MKFEEVLPAYREGKTISCVNPFNPEARWYYNFHEVVHHSRGLIFRKEGILSETWLIEPDDCTRCKGTGKEPETETETETLCMQYCNSCGNPCCRPAGHASRRHACAYCYART
jgi:hypothetical protein